MTFRLALNLAILAVLIAIALLIPFRTLELAYSIIFLGVPVVIALILICRPK